ncbi:HAD family hydrolase [Xanthovirga aplysinae]|uniref:HAD family hydrolase n=1 Tax=Xanthovirga aplysinae TaxID=2529853 RepID=UPI0012BD0DDA|nr:HAD family phosphatase [Xanthovirga aplysinae]MTI33456.1 HAD family phosphatase [Xanthovirga aplysinae]
MLNRNLIGIKNIIFDLGGVIINIDQQLAFHKFSGLAGCSFTEFKHRMQQSGFINVLQNYERGLITSKDFRAQLCQSIGRKIDDEFLDIAWNSMLLDIPSERLELLLGLRKNFKLVLLSNTNKIHHDEFISILKKKSGKADFSSYFDRVYYSFQMQKIKPEVEIFEQVLQEQSWEANETLFIDDNIENISAAEFLGIKTLHINGDGVLMKFFGK